MKLILRNFWSTIKHYRQSSIFNIAGLAFAFAICYIIYVQTTYEFGFGKTHKDYERIHRVNLNLINSSLGKNAIGSTIVKTAMEDFPIVEFSTLINVLSTQSLEYDTDSGKEHTTYKLMGTDTCLNKIFNFEMLAGDFNNISIKNNIVIPLSMAVGIWKDAETAMGKNLHSQQGKMYNVAGVYRDFTNQSVIKNQAYYAPKRDYSNFDGFNQTQYFKVTKEATESDIKNMLDEIAENQIFKEFQKQNGFTLPHTPLSDIYFDKAEYMLHPTGNKVVSISLIFIAFIIIMIALINFINFSIAIAPRRIKSINTYRVLGHSLNGLRVMLVCEAIFTTIIAVIISFGLIELISDTTIVNIIATDIGISENIDAIGIMIGTALLMGIITGLYPAVYMTSFEPALVLNGGKSLPRSAHWIRPILMSFQYIISITLIIVSLFINNQTQFIINKNYGYDINNTLTIDVSNLTNEIIEKLKGNSNIEDITISNTNILNDGTYSVYLANLNDSSEKLYSALFAGHNYPDFFGLDIYEGEDFTEIDEYGSDGYNYALLNETAKKEFNAKIGDIYDNNKVKVKGFFRDINFKSLHNPITPFAIIVSRPQAYNSMFVRYNKSENRTTVIDFIKETISEINKGEQSTVITATDSRNISYKKEIELNKLITWSTIIAILIASIGIIGLISLESKQRIREIAIRKINGATTTEILKLLNTKFLKLMIISYVISLPLAWYIVNSWLSQFEYKVTVSPWIFIVSGLGVMALTVVLVTIQSYRAATTNPSRAMNH